MAATSIAKRLGLPTRLVTVLEGESLVNDASALVLLKAALGGHRPPRSQRRWAIAGDFLYSVVIAVGVGLVVGVVNVWVRSRLNDPVLETAISFVVPFVAFIPARVAGRIRRARRRGRGHLHRAPRPRSRSRAQARLSEQINWRTSSSCSRTASSC